MPKTRPPTTGYARLAQAEDYTDEEDEDNDLPIHSQHSLQPAGAPRYAFINAPRPNAGMRADGGNTPTRFQNRGRSNSSGVDIKAINARLERWADEIASKFKIGKVKGKTDEEERLEIHHSVFQAPDWIRPANPEQLAAAGHGRMTTGQFEDIVENVRVAIEQGVHPKMISQGSSGSYFARNIEGDIVGVFKPKDEEPYAAGNPKWNKWIHRNLFPCFFGRACLIPNLSYVSEAAAYTLDCRLETNLVPYTDVVYLSSKSFHYDFWARRNFYRKKKPFPMKPGSFQVFLQGFSDATIFLRKHPWPDRLNSGFKVSDAPARKKRPWNDPCRPSGAMSDDEGDGEYSPSTPEETNRRKFFWTEKLQTAFREELEKLVILDYIMRNTDRGLDNWMIKVDWEKESVCIVSDPPRMSTREDTPGPRPASRNEHIGLSDLPQPHPYRQQEPMYPGSSRTGSPIKDSQPTMSIGAIDNSLSWPWKHPDAWRSFPYGWLFLPVSLIGQPFSQKSREHFLPLLTSKQWWSETQLALRKVFSQDVDFQERMFARQMAVMKGQAWNVVETLKTPDHGPLELTRRARVCVWDDLVDIPVAVPMRVPSFDIRRRQREAEPNGGSSEEMDISAANASAPTDLIRFGSPPAELPNPNRFELSPRPSEESSKRLIPFSSHSEVASVDGPAQMNRNPASLPSTRFRNGSVNTAPQTNRRDNRELSFSTLRGSHGQLMYDNDDLEGDLGYAAAEDMEHNHRKVIVERLETVKSKNPVFTWC